MRQALFASDAPNEYRAWAAHDARADGGYRMTLLAPRRITIMRRLRGVKMHLQVPVENYEGVVLAQGPRQVFVIIEQEPFATIQKRSSEPCGSGAKCPIREEFQASKLLP